MGGSFLQIIDRKDDACGLKQLKRAKERRRKREHCVCDVDGSLESNFFRMDRVIASKSSKTSSKESRSSYKGNARREDGGEERVIRADHYRCRWTGHESRRRDIRSNSNDNRGVEAENLSCPRNNRARKISAEKKKLQRLVPGLDFDCSTETRIGEASHLLLLFLLLFSQSRCYCFLHAPFCSFFLDGFLWTFLFSHPLSFLLSDRRAKNWYSA